MERVLSKKLIGKKAHRELLAYLRERLASLEPPAEKAAWLRKTARIRREVLRSFFRGHPPGLLDQKPEVQWLGTLDPGNGYRIRKLRYEGYPGMWIPALLYEPTTLEGKVPAVLNPNGHHAGGKAMAYKQARCINLAKRGMLALNTEFIGMGELRANCRWSPEAACRPAQDTRVRRSERAEGVGFMATQGLHHVSSCTWPG